MMYSLYVVCGCFPGLLKDIFITVKSIEDNTPLLLQYFICVLLVVLVLVFSFRVNDVFCNSDTLFDD